MWLFFFKKKRTEVIIYVLLTLRWTVCGCQKTAPRPLLLVGSSGIWVGVITLECDKSFLTKCSFLTLADVSACLTETLSLHGSMEKMYSLGHYPSCFYEFWNTQTRMYIRALRGKKQPGKKKHQCVKVHTSKYNIFQEIYINGSQIGKVWE